MPKSDNKKIVPFPILLIMICIGVLSVLMVFGLPPMSLEERNILKNFILVLIVIVFFYFLLRVPIEKLLYKLLPKRKLSFKELVSSAAPAGFKVEVALREKFSFCYPEDWQLVKPANRMLYTEVREVYPAKGIVSGRNFNVSFQDISQVENLDFLFNAIINGVLKALKGSKLEFKGDFRTGNMFGANYKINYCNAQKRNLCCYQIGLTNQNRKSLILLTFTTDQKDFSESKVLFDKIASLVQIFT